MAADFMAQRVEDSTAQRAVASTVAADVADARQVE
jgi:hypothetical protein